jgi:OOP family OmpA-OmpF porin
MLICRRGLLAGLSASAATMPAASALAQASLDSERTRILRSLAPDTQAPQSGGPAPRPPRQVSADDSGSRVVVSVSSVRTVDLTVFFDFDSDVILPRGARTLVALADVLRAPVLARSRILIAGHTDARGRADYNVDLSFRRARAVREHLVVVHEIEARRLLVHGFGPTELKDASRPFDASNRRVEVAVIVD